MSYEKIRLDSDSEGALGRRGEGSGAKPRAASAMAAHLPELIICALIISCAGSIYVFSHAFQGALAAVGHGESFRRAEYAWIFRLGANCFGYACVFVPGLFVHRYVRRTRYLERRGGDAGCVPGLVARCFGDGDEGAGEGGGGAPLKPEPSPPEGPRAPAREAALLATCFAGLMGSYLTWGLLQEKVMTQAYTGEGGTVGHFKDSQFLVFVNRILAFAMSGCYIYATRQPRHRAPIYKYSFCSFSNILSAWCQYEALKYVSFPTQVLAKSCKIIPVMIMGKVVSRAKYEYYEYVTAVLISVGMAFFMLGSADDNKVKTVTTISGIILLASYMMFDSFTSNWQGALFKSYAMSSMQMMFGVNLFSCLFTSVSLMQQGGFADSLQFMIDYPKFIVDCVLLSISSTAGQFFIFYTIATFGPVAFTIIMTLRQGIAILLSCLVYQHHVSAVGIIGILVVFAAVFLRVYCKQRLRTVRMRLESLRSRNIV